MFQIRLCITPLLKYKECQQNDVESLFPVKFSDNSKIVTVNFWEALIASEIGLFYRFYFIRLFYPRNPDSYAAFRLSGCRGIDRF